MVISTQHLVPSESTKSKGATAAPDPAPQAGKQSGFGRLLPYPHRSRRASGKKNIEDGLAEIVVTFFFLPFRFPCRSCAPSIKDLSRTLPRSQMAPSRGHQHLPLHPCQVIRPRLTKTQLSETLRPGLSLRHPPRWRLIRKKERIPRPKLPFRRISQRRNSNSRDKGKARHSRSNPQKRRQRLRSTCSWKRVSSRWTWRYSTARALLAVTIRSESICKRSLLSEERL